jgi:NAD(P)-dependent dehydrogenase (short-subunit alcohol dehydrogenase family)
MGQRIITMKQALITGGTSGIGMATAQSLLDKGYAVTVTGLTQKEVEDCPLPCHKLTLDVTKQEEVDALYANFKRLDALVNCAGMIVRAGKEFEIDNFMKVIDVNLHGTMRMCVGAKPLLEKHEGAIVNIASIRSIFGSPITPAYSASKGAVTQLTKSLALAWASSGIRVNCIAPGWIETPLTQALRDNNAANADIINRTPQARWGQPKEIGDIIAFLLSKEASFITGSMMVADGGYSVL